MDVIASAVAMRVNHRDLGALLPSQQARCHVVFRRRAREFRNDFTPRTPRASRPRSWTLTNIDTVVDDCGRSRLICLIAREKAVGEKRVAPFDPDISVARAAGDRQSRSFAQAPSS
jgi:hypothetical protein